MRRVVTSALALSVLIAPTAYAISRIQTTPALAGGQVTASGFDKCQAPSSSAMRSWLGSTNRVVNIYFAGNNRACANQTELTPQWLTTVTSNGWSVIPTYVGSQAGCTSSSKTHKISASTAATQGVQEADDAATQMQALGLGPQQNNPIYFDMEPYPVGSSHTTCDNAVMTFLDAWSRELHVQGYLSGAYGTTNTVMKQLVARQGDATFQQPDDIWYADWNGVNGTTGEPGIPDDFWQGHRIHQYRGGHNETFNGQTFNIDNDAVAGDVVAAVAPTPPPGPPYHYAAAPAAGSNLKERSTPDTATGTTDNTTGVTYPSGSDLSIECQIVGGNVHGSVVWDKLSDGGYVADINTTTTGGLSFTAGVARCDTGSPIAAMHTMPIGTLKSSKTVSWSGTDDASGISSYDVRYRTASWDGDLTGFHGLLTATTKTKASVPLSVGTRYCFEVRATDASGNVGDWSADACIARAVDDRALTAGHAWNRASNSRYFRRTATATHNAGAVVKLIGAHFTTVGVVATTSPGGGSINVYANRRLLGSLSLRATRHAEKQMFMLPAVSARTANIRITTTNEDALVRIDGIVVSD
jgi:hypothetical protein